MKLSRYRYTLTLAAALLALLGWLIIRYGITSDWKDECRAAGGVPVNGRGSNVCIDRDAVIEP